MLEFLQLLVYIMGISNNVIMAVDNERLYWSKLRDPGKDTACSRYKTMIQAEGDRRP